MPLEWYINIHLFSGIPWLKSLRTRFWGTLDRVISIEGSRWLGDIEGNLVREGVSDQDGLPSKHELHLGTEHLNPRPTQQGP